MPVDPESIAPGKRYVTATKHLRTVLEVTADRVRYAYGDGPSAGSGQWRWQAKAKFANDVAAEISPDTVSQPAAAAARTEPGRSETSVTNGQKLPGARKILTRR